MREEFYIGDWLVQPQRNVIRGVDGETHVKPKTMAVLVCLADSNGKVVDKRDLMDTVWGSAIVSEDVLTQAVVELRRAFGDQARDPSVIETIHRVGFRLLPKIRTADPVTAEKSRGTRRMSLVLLAAALGTVLLWNSRIFHREADPPNASVPSVAVLPFVNLSDENEYFSDGLSEEILHTISSLPGLRVTARTSSFAFKRQNKDVREVGRHLNVSSVLEGSVRRDGDKVRITAQLIDVSSGYHLWSSTYDRDFEDAFTLQEEISEAIAAALQLTLAEPEAPSHSRPGTSEPDAYASYLLGRHHMATRLGDWAGSAQDAFQRAIRIDPGFARAYAALAETYLVFHETPGSFSGPANVSFDSAIAAAEAAIESSLALDPDLPTAYVARANLAAIQGDLQSEEADLHRAIELRPRFAAALTRLGANLVSQNQQESALAFYRSAELLDPMNPALIASLSRLIAQSGGYELAISYPLKIVDSGLRSPQVYLSLIAIAGEFGDLRARLEWSIELARLTPHQATSLAELADTYMVLGAYPLAEHWIQAASSVSPLEAFKAHARLLIAQGRVDDALGLAEALLAADPPRENATLTPAQSGPAALGGIANLLSGNFSRAVELLNLTMRKSPTFARRPVYLKLYGRNFLAAAHIGLDQKQVANGILQENIDIYDSAAARGLGQHPPLLFQLSKTYALLGRRDEAVDSLRQAVNVGWRACYLEGRRTMIEYRLFPTLVISDPAYRALIDAACEDVERLRIDLRADGLLLTRDQL